MEDAPETRPGGRGRRSARGKGRQVIVEGLVRTRRSNFGGDPSTTGAKRPPNSREGARCDAAFQKEGGHPVDLCVPDSTRRSGVYNQLVVFNDVHVVFSDVRVVFSDVRVVFDDYQVSIQHTSTVLLADRLRRSGLGGFLLVSDC
jgi:hypothetical protein